MGEWVGALQRQVDELADALGRSVVVDDPGVQLVCASRHFGDEDPVRVAAVLQRATPPVVVRHVLAHTAGHRAATAVPARDDLGLRARWCTPVHRAGLLLGYLMVVATADQLAVEDRRRIERTAERIGELLAAERTGRDAEDDAIGRAVLALVGPDDAAAGAAAAELRDALGPVPSAGVAVTLLAGPEDALSAAGSGQTYHRPRVLPAGDGASRRAVVVHRADRDPVRERAGGGAVVAGTGAIVTDWSALRGSARQAEAALRAATLLPRCGGRARWDRLGPLAPLLLVPADQLTDALLPDALRRLEDHPQGDRLRTTLSVFLDHGGAMPATAAALHLHRTSLYYRLRRLTELTGVDLDDGRVRLELHQGLLLRELLVAARPT